MSKRFTDTEKWQRPWFRGLPVDYKMAWLYILDTCDIAGIWYVDFGLASFCIGAPITYDKTLEVLEKQITVLNNGSKWYVHDYVQFHCGGLNTSVNFHRAVRQRLIENGITPDQEVGNTDKHIHKHKNENKHKIIYIGKHFEPLWDQYPSKVGRKRAERYFNSSVITEKDLEDIQTALDNYKTSKRVKGGFVQNGSTWFGNWQDWVENPENEHEQKELRAKTKKIDAEIESMVNGSVTTT